MWLLQAGELEWGAEGSEAAVARLAALKPDIVMAADCCYIDQDGQSPSTPDFIRACKGRGVCLQAAGGLAEAATACPAMRKP